MVMGYGVEDQSVRNLYVTSFKDGPPTELDSMLGVSDDPALYTKKNVTWILQRIVSAINKYGPKPSEFYQFLDDLITNGKHNLVAFIIYELVAHDSTRKAFSLDQSTYKALAQIFNQLKNLEDWKYIESQPQLASGFLIRLGSLVFIAIVTGAMLVAASIPALLFGFLPLTIGAMAGGFILAMAVGVFIAIGINKFLYPREIRAFFGEITNASKPLVDFVSSLESKQDGPFVQAFQRDIVSSVDSGRFAEILPRGHTGERWQKFLAAGSEALPSGSSERDAFLSLTAHIKRETTLSALLRPSGALNTEETNSTSPAKSQTHAR